MEKTGRQLGPHAAGEPSVRLQGVQPVEIRPVKGAGWICGVGEDARSGGEQGELDRSFQP